MATDELFPIGVPAGEGHVVDRARFIADLMTYLTDRVSIVISAPRRTGKTSVAHEVLRRLRREGVLTGAVDLAGVLDIGELADRLTLECLTNLSPVGRAARRIGGGIRDLLRHPDIRVSMHDLEIAASFGGWDDVPSWRKLDVALGLPEVIAQKAQKTFVIMFDEFQAASILGSRALLERMRSAFQLQRGTAFLFLGSQGGVMRHLFESRGQPFFRYALMKALPDVPEEAWRSYVRERLRTRGVTVDETALDAILEITGGHPYDTMEVSYHAYLLTRDGADRITRPIVLGAADEVQDMLATVFDAEMEAMGAKARIVLGRLANGHALYRGDESSHSGIANTLTDLVSLGVLTRRGRGRYAFVEPMLRRHLVRRA